MRMHLSFRNGGNPYFTFDLTKKQLKAEIRKWSKNWILYNEHWFGDIVFFDAVEKNPPRNLFWDFDEEE